MRINRLNNSMFLQCFSFPLKFVFAFELRLALSCSYLISMWVFTFCKNVVVTPSVSQLMFLQIYTSKCFHFALILYCCFLLNISGATTRWRCLKRCDVHLASYTSSYRVIQCTDIKQAIHIMHHFVSASKQRCGY